MKNLYAEQWRLFKTKYGIHFLWIFILFFLSGLTAYFYLLRDEKLLVILAKWVTAMFNQKDIAHLDAQTGELAFGLFWNNSVACLLIFLSGFIPVFLPTLAIICFNGAIIGIIMAYLKFNGNSVMEFLLAGVVPHGIFEIPAIILAGALAVTITLGVYQKLDNRRFPLKSVILDAFKTFLFVCLPLLLIAALVESFITPWFLGV